VARSRHDEPTATLEDFPTLNDLRRIASLTTDTEPTPARRGKLGACRACQQSAASHFDSAGRWLGCTAAPDAVTFVLWPVSTATNGSTPPPTPTLEPAQGQPQRRFYRARHYYAGPRDLSSLTLSDHRRRVLEAIRDAGKAGTLSRDVVKATKLSYGSVTQATDWLQNQHLIESRGER
jgi:hypothetical protein